MAVPAHITTRKELFDALSRCDDRAMSSIRGYILPGTTDRLVAGSTGEVTLSLNIGSVEREDGSGYRYIVTGRRMNSVIKMYVQFDSERPRNNPLPEWMR